MENCCEELPKGCNGKVSIICGAKIKIWSELCDKLLLSMRSTLINAVNCPKKFSRRKCQSVYWGLNGFSMRDVLGFV